MEKYNPIANWRGSRSPCMAAYTLGMTQRSYLTLEAHPEKSKIKSNRIIKVSQITGIPLPVLVDWLTETTTKEMA